MVFCWLLCSSLVLLLSLLLVWQQPYGCYGCVEEERRALLDIRAAFDTPGNASNLGSWVGDDGSDCCSWERVKCGSITRRVVSLDLDGARSWDDVPEDIDTTNQYYPLNATLFLPFQELRSLVLHNNTINPSVLDTTIYTGYSTEPSEMRLVYSDDTINVFDPNADRGFEKWSKLSKLEYLDLSMNFLDDTNLPSLGALTSLRALSLERTFSGDNLPVHGLKSWKNLSKLKYLDLSDNLFNESIITSLVGISSLICVLFRNNRMHGRLPIPELSKLNLEELDLGHNSFVGNLPPFEDQWTSLKALSLWGNNLNGTLPTKAFCRMNKLQELDLSRNDFTGVLPSCLQNLTSLKLLDISFNQFKFSISSSPIVNLTSLKHISLSENGFEGTIYFGIFANHSNLKTVELAGYNTEIAVKTEDPQWIPSFQLENLILSHCNLNKGSGAIPSFLSTQDSLGLLDLSNNNLKGSFPSWLLANNPGLFFLYLNNNSLSGPILLPILPMENLSDLDIGQNQLHGQLPTKIGNQLPAMAFLNLSNNHFQESIPSSMRYMKNLVSIDLSKNSLTGELPIDIASEWSSLVLLNLANNSLHGRMFPGNSNLISLMNINLNNNNFAEEFPDRLCNSLVLTVLHISGNQLSGRLPPCIGNLTRLASLKADGNQLEGSIPIEFCKLEALGFLDLSGNNLSGTVPSCFKLPSLKYLHLGDNGFTGPFPSALAGCPSLMTLDIRNNSFHGELPDWIGTSTLQKLRVLLLKGNHFGGPIPSQICQLKQLNILDLSHNSFSGHIPSCFHNIKPTTSFELDLGPFFFDLFEPNDILRVVQVVSIEYVDNIETEEVAFTTKSRSNHYKGDILNFMYGMDLSCNQLVGEIPPEIGGMNWLRSLNLSNNNLSGPIPQELSNITDIESLDLSHNMLTDGIPSQLKELYKLEVFSVAYNQLSGPTIGTYGQFATFDESSYEGNPGLCGYPLKKSCSPKPMLLPAPSIEEDREDTIDTLVFFASFALSLVIGFWGFMSVLYFKVAWRYKLFRTVDACMGFAQS